MSKQKILIIDDEPGIRDTIRELLEFNDFEVATAADGKEGIRKMQQFKPELVLCDWMMPVMDGLEVLQETRECATMGNVPFIFISAKTERDDIRLAMGIGADDFITKPFKAHELLEAITSKLKRFAGFKEMLEEQHINLPNHFSKYGFHEFNTPINALIGGFDFLIEYEHEVGSTERVELLGSMRTAAFRLKRAYTNLMLYTKIMRAEPIYSFNYTSSPLEAFNKAMLRLKIVHGSIEVKAQVEHARLMLRIEALELIIYELLDNAVKFGRLDDVPEVSGKPAADGRSYLLTVTDQGEGMTAAEIEAIGPMVQFKRNVRELQGWGLGLFLVKNLCDANRLHLDIQSSASGTSVVLVFPLV